MSDKTPKQVAIDAATFLLHSYSAGLHDMRPSLAAALVKAVTVALTTGEWSPDARYDGIPVDHPLRFATTTTSVTQAATLDLAADETAALRRMYCGEDGDASTALRWVATEIGDEWRHGHRYILVVTHADHPGLWGISVRQVEGDEPSHDLEDANAATLRPVYSVPSMAYSFHAPAPTA